MAPTSSNPLQRLRNIPARLGDERIRARQRHERKVVANDHLRPILDRSGRLRQSRTERINEGRGVDGTARLLRFMPGPLEERDWSARRINVLGDRLHAKRYLEIGIFEGRTFENVTISRRVGVDPAPRFDLSLLPRRSSVEAVTSDVYFTRLRPSVRFDLAFVDGLHTVEQTYRDIINTFAHLPRGPLLIDDTVPSDEISAIPDQEESYRARDALGEPGRQWHGDVWRVMLLLERHHDELEWRTIIDGGNPQTLLWRRRPGQDVRSASPGQIAAAMEPKYAEVFAEGTPAFFVPTPEARALRECVVALGS